MNESKGKIYDVINGILVQKGARVPELSDELRLIHDLGLSSLDIAQLIARLEIELGLDPFSEGTAELTEVRSIGKLCEVYQVPAE